jgi:uncharacterized membrane protein
MRCREGHLHYILQAWFHAKGWRNPAWQIFVKRSIILPFSVLYSLYPIALTAQVSTMVKSRKSETKEGLLPLPYKGLHKC